MKTTDRSKYQNVAEGQLSYVPPPKRVGPFNKRPRKSQNRSTRNFDTSKKDVVEDFAGWRESQSRYYTEMYSLSPKGKHFRQKGQADGYSRADMTKAKEFVERILVDDIELNKLLATVEAENPVGAWALKEIVKLAAMPGAMRDRKDLLKIVLEYTKEKPVSKKQVQVDELTQDDFVTKLTGFAEEGTDWTPKN